MLEIIDYTKFLSPILKIFPKISFGSNSYFTKRLEERGFNQVTAFLQQDNFIELLEKENSVKQSSLNRKERLESPNPFRLKKAKSPYKSYIN